MESKKDSKFLNVIKTRKGMIKQELLPFLSPQEIKALLKLCKATKSIVSEHYTNHWKNLSSYIANHYQLDQEIMKEFESYQQFKEASLLLKV